MTPRRHRVGPNQVRAWRRLLGAAVVVVVLAAWGFRAPLLQSAADFLVVDDTPEPSRYLVLLAGELEERPRKAAELFHRGIGDVVLICRVEAYGAARAGLVPDETTLQIRLLERYGVPSAAIVVLGPDYGLTSTYEEATTIRDYLAAQRHVGPLVVVTSALHTRRARWVFSRALADRPIRLHVVAAPHHTFDATNWWQTEDGLIYLNNEYLKFARYVARSWFFDDGL